MPAKDGLRLDEDQNATPSGPDPGQPDPQKPVEVPKPNRLPRALALEDVELMAEGEYFGLECSSAAELGTEGPKDG